MKTEDIGVSYATDSYLIQETGGVRIMGNTQIYKYDLRTKKKTRLLSNEANLQKRK